MRRLRVLPLAALLLVSILSTARADEPYGGRGHGDRPERASAWADSVREHRAWQVWGHAGLGWLAAPAQVRTHYGAGLDAGLSLDRRFADHAALRVRFAHHDLPSNQPTFFVATGSPFGTTLNSGHGWADTGMGGLAVRTWRHLWLEGAAGGGYFHDGAPTGPASIDPQSGATRDLADHTGWGGAWGAGLRYEFQRGRRDVILAEVQVLSLERRGTALDFVTLGAGFRAF